MKYIPDTKEELKNLTDNENIKLGNIDTSKITDMSGLFKNSKRKDFSGIETWDVSNVTDMSEMFCGAENFNEPLNTWNTVSLKNTKDMFKDAKNYKQSESKSLAMPGKWTLAETRKIGNGVCKVERYNDNKDGWKVSGVRYTYNTPDNKEVFKKQIETSELEDPEKFIKDLRKDVEEDSFEQSMKLFKDFRNAFFGDSFFRDDFFRNDIFRDDFFLR